MPPVIDKLEAKFKSLFSSHHSSDKAKEGQEAPPLPTSAEDHPASSTNIPPSVSDPLPSNHTEGLEQVEAKEAGHPLGAGKPKMEEDTGLGDKPVFNSQEVLVIFVLGGPGAGKGTQCAKLVEDYGFVHLSAGDLLRAEQKRENSPYGALIQNFIKEGKVVPMEITIKLLQNSMQDAIDSKTKAKADAAAPSDNEVVQQEVPKEKIKFLIDGFPRKMDQAIKFEESVCVASLILFLTCPESVLLDRLLERGKTSGREDDNEESIKKRFRTFIDTSMPVVDYYRAEGKVAEISSTGTIEEVYEQVKTAVKAVF